MCVAKGATGTFDPMICPLLRDLPPEEQAERMRDDPRIRACIAAMGDGPPGASVAPRIAKRLAAYEIACRETVCDALAGSVVT
jgi:hypothetical protein